ncbi:hypothetical protein EVAR_11675_1 [Eumeta japonica]|uniref:Uncharacterized protein n=1 Tax=Eumeta variegata TaxID=151549 RepID=A0A4C1U4V7_EUMVA|nr:hypothetical protein EVAR_11675_1 [Eumeta japonica]
MWYNQNRKYRRGSTAVRVTSGGGAPRAGGGAARMPATAPRAPLPLAAAVAVRCVTEAHSPPTPVGELWSGARRRPAHSARDGPPLPPRQTFPRRSPLTAPAARRARRRSAALARPRRRFEGSWITLDKLVVRGGGAGSAAGGADRYRRRYER